MLSKEIIKVIESLDNKYIIGGSNAIMIYIGQDIRECKDLDLHLSKPIDIGLIENLAKMKIDVQYDQPEYSIVSGVRVLKLEKIISYKINRLLLKDIYDLSYLLKLDFNINEIQIHSQKKILKEDYNNIDFSETIEKINKIIKYQQKGVACHRNKRTCFEV